jgi:hypothetical protein
MPNLCDQSGPDAPRGEQEIEWRSRAQRPPADFGLVTHQIADTLDTSERQLDQEQGEFDAIADLDELCRLQIVDDAGNHGPRESSGRSSAPLIEVFNEVPIGSYVHRCSVFEDPPGNVREKTSKLPDCDADADRRARRGTGP